MIQIDKISCVTAPQVISRGRNWIYFPINCYLEKSESSSLTVLLCLSLPEPRWPPHRTTTPTFSNTSLSVSPDALCVD